MAQPQLKKALIIGGRNRFITDAIGPKLAHYGIGIAEHWDMDRKKNTGTVPAGTEVVILFKDMHGQATSLAHIISPQTRRMGIPFISTTRQGSVFRADLAKFGFSPVAYEDEEEAPVPQPASPPPAPEPAEGMNLPTWVMQSIKTGTPILLSKENETSLFHVGRERRFVVLVRVTPADAERWLENRMAGQRPVSQRHVEELAAALKRGEYHLTHQGVAFDKEGMNQDGQHRLWAIFNSGVTVDLNVTFGQEVEAMKVIDGKIKPRTVWQSRQLITKDAHSKKRLEAMGVIRLLIYPELRNAPSFDEAEELIAAFQAGLDWVVTLPTKKLYCTSTVRGALAYAHATAPGMVEAFATQVLYGENLQRGMPAFCVRGVLETTVGRNNRRDLALRVLRACQGYIQAETMPKVYAAEETVTFFGKVHGIKGSVRTKQQIPGQQIPGQGKETEPR